MIPIKYSIAYLIIFLLYNNTILSSKSIYRKQINNSEIEIEFDMYYTALAYYLPLTETAIPYTAEKNEFKIYKKLIASPIPRFLVFELSSYPMPSLGVFIRKQLPQFYESMDITDNLNLVKSVCAGFEEPYAVSIFLGNVISFKPKGKKDVDGKGYIGLLVSGGNYHIKDNESIVDNWIEGEAKIKGDKTTPDGKMSWSFRFGTKFHHSVYIKDIFYFSLRRSRTDYGKIGSSLFKNSNFEYVFDVDTRKYNFIKHLFLVGKKFPLKNKKITFSISTGFLWEETDKYTGLLERTDEDKNFQILFRPNVEF